MDGIGRAFILESDVKISFVLCSNFVVRFVTILAPHDSPNTDGIDPGKYYLTMP